MRVVLAWEAEIYGSGKNPACVKARVEDITFEGIRRQAAEQSARTNRRGSSERAAKKSGAELVQDDFGWKQPAQWEGNFFRSGNSLPPAQVQAISAAARSITNGPELPHLIQSIDPDWLPPPLKFCGSDGQRPLLDLSSPTIAGDFAFVGADYLCPLCGQGGFLVLKRADTGWTIVAEANLWVS